MEVRDIRQSDEWSEYLKMYGWTSHRLSSGNILRISNIGPLRFAKLHRPTSLNVGEILELKELVKKYSVTSLKISPSPGNSLELLRTDGFKETRNIDLPPSTLLVDLSVSEDVLWGDFLPDCRRSIKKSQRDLDRIEIIQSPTRKNVEDYYKVVSSRGAKKGFYVQSLQDQVRKTEVFKEKSFIVNVYSKEDKILGTKMFLGFKGTIWYMHGGITSYGQTSNGGYLIIWEALKHFKELGYKLFDFESMADKRLQKLTKSWRGYTEFKRKFGGQVVEYPLPFLKYYRFLSLLNLLD